MGVAAGAAAAAARREAAREPRASGGNAISLLAPTSSSRLLPWHREQCPHTRPPLHHGPALWRSAPTKPNPRAPSRPTCLQALMSSSTSAEKSSTARSSLLTWSRADSHDWVKSTHDSCGNPRTRARGEQQTQHDSSFGNHAASSTTRKLRRRDMAAAAPTRAGGRALAGPRLGVGIRQPRRLPLPSSLRPQPRRAFPRLKLPLALPFPPPGKQGLP